ncbi:hypothetical protein TW65_03665 [Stemphylium lycopersici]|nr:hypothetical protein TW65_03665 [Stemphylium lycopersici]
MHFPSTLAASASLLATTIFVGSALAAAPKDIWTTTPSGFADSTASPVDGQLVVPIFTPSFRATPAPVTGSQDGIQARWEGHGQKWKPEFYCPYHRDFAKYQACVAIGQAEAVVKILDEAIIHLTEVSEPRGDEGCLERVDYAKFKACYVLPMLEKAEVFNQRMVDTLREAAIGPYDVQRPKSRRSIRVFSGDNHSVADGEDGFTTDNSDAQDAAMNQDGEGGWTTAEDEASGPKEAGMVADGDGGITTDDEAETTAWYANDEAKDAMREKIQKPRIRIHQFHQHSQRQVRSPGPKRLVRLTRHSSRRPRRRG